MTNDLYIIGIGVSAGGLQAVTSLLSAFKEDPEAAIVIVQHLKRDVPSQLAGILQKKTNLKVAMITDGVKVGKNTVYVMPENQRAEYRDGRLFLNPRPEEETVNKAVNHFFFSLAEHGRDKAIGIIMSGTGSDGTEGCYALEKNGGVVIVQEPSTAQFDGMPLSTIKYDHPDYVLKPEEMPAVIKEIVKGSEGKSGRRQRSLTGLD